MPPLRSSAGQASAEYVAVLLVVALALAAGAAAVVPDVGERVVRTVRTGLCIVGGDVCRVADARAAGLAPCLTSERFRRQETTVDIAVVRVGGQGEWQLAVQSDGQASVTRLEENEVGGTLGVGVSFSPVGIEADVSGALLAGYRSGTAWRFAGAPAAAAFLAGAERDAAVADGRAPAVTWRALSGAADGEAAVAVAALAQAGIAASAEAAIGLRREGVRRTLAFAVSTAGPDFFADLPGFPSAAGAHGAAVAEVSWDRGALVELVVRSGAGDGQRLEEYTARLDLRDATARDATGRLLRPGAGAAELRTLARLVARQGSAERAVYAVTESRRGFSAAGRLGLALGLEHTRVTGERSLVDAVSWSGGGPPRRRFDCLGA